MDIVFSPDRASGCLGAEETQGAIRRGEATLLAAQSGSPWRGLALGWFSVAESAPEAELGTILAEAARVRENASAMIVIGIGGCQPVARSLEMSAFSSIIRNLPSASRNATAGSASGWE